MGARPHPERSYEDGQPCPATGARVFVARAGGPDVALCESVIDALAVASSPLGRSRWRGGDRLGGNLGDDCLGGGERARYALELSPSRQARPLPFGRTAAGPRRLSGPFLAYGGGNVPPLFDADLSKLVYSCSPSTIQSTFIWPAPPVFSR